jgi:hypothetical protein
MTTATFTQPTTLEALSNHIRHSRKITRQDQQLLMQFGFDQPQSSLLNQIYDLLRQGAIRVVD